MPVDFEFAVNDGKLHVLQCRPLGSRRRRRPATRCRTTCRRSIRCSARRRWVSNGLVEDIELRRARSTRATTRGSRASTAGSRSARVVGRLNDALAEQGLRADGARAAGAARTSASGVRVGVRRHLQRHGRSSRSPASARATRPSPRSAPTSSRSSWRRPSYYLPLYPDDPDVVFNEECLHEGPNALAEIVPGLRRLRGRRSRDRRRSRWRRAGR